MLYFEMSFSIFLATLPNSPRFTMYKDLCPSCLILAAWLLAIRIMDGKGNKFTLDWSRPGGGIFV